MTTTPTKKDSANGRSQNGGESSSGGHNPSKVFEEDLIPPAVDDNVPTGSIKMLQSPHVSEGPGRIANAPVPSVYVSLCLSSLAL